MDSARTNEYRTHLGRQLEFLRQACGLYDNGYEDIAVKIAVAIRVLTHDTQNSTSLLSLLGAANTTLLSTSPQLVANTVFFGGALSGCSSEDGGW
jgi:hypothetical protein